MWVDISPGASFSIVSINTLCEISGILYAGGVGNESTAYGWAYDVSIGWTNITGIIPGTIYAMVVVNDLLYAGGYDYGGQSFCYVYSPVTSVWTNIEFTIARGITIALCSSNGIVYAATSNIPNGPSVIQSYDTIAPAGWNDLSWPSPDFIIRALYILAPVLFVGGQGAYGAYVQAYNTATPAGWIDIFLPLSGGIVNGLYGIGTILYAGGQDGIGNAFVQAYDTSTSSGWIGMMLNIPGGQVYTLYAKDTILFAGGQDGSGNAFVQSYDTATSVGWIDTSIQAPGLATFALNGTTGLYAAGVNGFVQSSILSPPPPWTGSNVLAIDMHDGSITVSWANPSTSADFYTVVDASFTPYPSQLIQGSSAVVSGLFNAANVTVYILASYIEGSVVSDTSANLTIFIPRTIYAGFLQGDIMQLTPELSLCGLTNPDSTTINAFAYDGVHIFVASNNILYSLNADMTVDLSYSFDTDTLVDMIVGGNRLYVGTDDGYLYSMNTDLSIDLSYQFVGDVISSLSYNTNRSHIYVGTYNGYVYSMDTSLHMVSSRLFTGVSVRSLCYNNSVLYVGTSSGYIYSLQMDLFIDLSYQLANMETIAGLCYGGSHLYVGTLQGSVYAFDSFLHMDSSQQFVGDTVNALTYGDENKVYALTSQGYVYRLNATTLSIDSSYNNPGSSNGYQHSILYVPPVIPSPPPIPPRPRPYVKPMSSKALRAANVFPDSRMRMRAIAGRELIRSLQGGERKYSSSADIVTTYAQGRAYILGRKYM